MHILTICPKVCHVWRCCCIFQAKQHSARHENAHSDEFALSGDQEGQQGGSKGEKDDKPVYVDTTPLTALFQVSSPPRYQQCVRC